LAADPPFFWNLISVNTEITDKKKFEGWVLYDADCRFCVRLARRLHCTLARRRFELLPLQTPWVRARFDLTNSELLAEMRLLTPGGNRFGGADAVLEISRHFWWAWPFRLMGHIPITLSLLGAGYRWIARHRHCAGGICEIKDSPVKGQKSKKRSGKRTVFFEMP
jgi:predicted DCC family thiol-disulfide oxidoreductase YuxK